MIVRTLKWVGGLDGFLELIDQRRLPGEFVELRCTDVEQLHEAIRTMAVRGAPAIGVAAAYGPVLAMQKLSVGDNVESAFSIITKACDYLATARPTAANLFWALDRVKRIAADFIADNKQAQVQSLHKIVLVAANVIYQGDVDMCLQIGQNGQRFIKSGAGILTHCNAGALATAGQGTALSLVFEAHKMARKFKVYVDETRPLLQGARITAWELKQAGINTTVICDNMAGWLMKQGKIDAVITGADRIAANGDTANKIGTYSLSILARKHQVPFYVAAPSSTFDLSIKSGEQIPIEERDTDEVIFFGGKKVVADGINIYNPSFDVTEARDITAIITEKGVIERPTAKGIAEHLK